MILKKFFPIAILVILFSCKNAPDRPEPILDPAYEPVTTTTSSTVPPANTAANTSGVKHYICPNNCAASGGPAAGTCPVCGTAYVHNQEFHNQGQSPITATPATPPAGAPGTPASGSTTVGEPPQNASGVWHYTCSTGCAGGAGSAVACATCGTTLVHNTLYHQ